MTGKIGNYQVLGSLGEGAHSEILHIRRSADARQYALKVVSLDTAEDAKFLEQARHEFRVAQMLDHPNLIKIYALETQSDWLFRVRKVHLLIEYVNGKTLDTGPKLSLPRLVQAFVLVASGVVHMHRKGVFHADLKPNNILLSKTGQVKVIDYGLSWIKGEKKHRLQGTPEYMAPETSANRIINERSDVYNFGAALYRMVTGKLPPRTVSDDGSGLPIDERTFRQMLKPVSELNQQAPAELADLIHRCLAFDPAQRPARMSEVQGALDHLADALIRSPEDRLERMADE